MAGFVLKGDYRPRGDQQQAIDQQIGQQLGGKEARRQRDPFPLDRQHAVVMGGVQYGGYDAEHPLRDSLPEISAQFRKASGFSQQGVRKPDPPRRQQAIQRDRGKLV